MPEAIYTDSIPTTVPEAPLIPSDLEEIGIRLVVLELQVQRMNVVLEGILESARRSWSGAFHLPSLEI